MPDYRAYILARDGHIQSFEPLVCADDVAAITAARGVVAASGCDVELWQGKRKVTTLTRKPK